MLTIRPEQTAALEREQRRTFIAAVARELRERFGLDGPSLEEPIGAAMRRAARYALAAPDDLRRFLHVCAMLGWDFDEQPEHAWAREILEDGGISSPSRRIRALYDEALHRDAVEARNAGWRELFA